MTALAVAPGAARAPSESKVGHVAGSRDKSGVFDRAMQSYDQISSRRIQFHRATMKRTGFNGETTTLVQFKAGGSAPQSTDKVKASSLPVRDTFDSEKSTVTEVRKRKALGLEERILTLLVWKKSFRVGAGLYNLGNTCFLNSVLQCLTYCPPLVQFLLTTSIPGGQSQQSFSVMCLLKDHFRKALRARTGNEGGGGGGGGGMAVAPKAIAMNIRRLGRQFRMGRQEDAHEFLRCILDGMQKECLRASGNPKAGPRSKLSLSTPVHRIFGGSIQSQVKCSRCGGESNTYDPMLDLSLEVKLGLDSVEASLAHFVKPEVLDAQNRWKCGQCEQLVKAQKRMAVHELPNVLTLHLKRFQFGGYGSKVNKYMRYKEYLDMKPFLSADGRRLLQRANKAAAAADPTTDPESPPRPTVSTKYRLSAVLVHEGHSTCSGHYYAFARNSTDTWYEFDDSSVRSASLNTVLNQRAYILMYVRLPGPPVKPQSVEDLAIKKVEEKAREEGNVQLAVAGTERKRKSVPEESSLETEGPQECTRSEAEARAQGVSTLSGGSVEETSRPKKKKAKMSTVENHESGPKHKGQTKDLKIASTPAVAHNRSTPTAAIKGVFTESGGRTDKEGDDRCAALASFVNNWAASGLKDEIVSAAVDSCVDVSQNREAEEATRFLDSKLSVSAAVSVDGEVVDRSKYEAANKGDGKDESISPQHSRTSSRSMSSEFDLPAETNEKEGKSENSVEQLPADSPAVRTPDREEADEDKVETRSRLCSMDGKEERKRGRKRKRAAVVRQMMLGGQGGLFKSYLPILTSFSSSFRRRGKSKGSRVKVRRSPPSAKSVGQIEAIAPSQFTAERGLKGANAIVSMKTTGRATRVEGTEISTETQGATAVAAKPVGPSETKELAGESITSFASLPVAPTSKHDSAVIRIQCSSEPTPAQKPLSRAEEGKVTLASTFSRKSERRWKPSYLARPEGLAGVREQWNDDEIEADGSGRHEGDKETGISGIDKMMLAEQKAHNRILRLTQKQEADDRRKARLDRWDAALDKGRTKKVKAKKDQEASNRHFSHNPFQQKYKQKFSKKGKNKA